MAVDKGMKKAILKAFHKGITNNNELAKIANCSVSYVNTVLYLQRQDNKQTRSIIQYLFVSTEKKLSKIANGMGVTIVYAKECVEGLQRASEAQEIEQEKIECQEYIFEDVIKEGKLTKTEFSDPAFIKRIRQRHLTFTKN